MHISASRCTPRRRLEKTCRKARPKPTLSYPNITEVDVNLSEGLCGMASSKRPRLENGGAADAPECGSCDASEAAAAPSVLSSSGRSLRKRPWEEEGFRCPFLDTINRTLLDFGV